MSSPSTAPDRTEIFLQLLNEHEASLRAYVHSLVREPSDAQDVLQEMRLVMWRQFDRFELGTNFRAWGRKIAFHQVLSFRRKAKRTALLGEEALELLATELNRTESQDEQRRAALHDCVRQMSRPHRQVFLMRYSRDMGIDEIAAAVERTEGAVYRLLSRLRIGLQQCVTQKTQNPTMT